MLGIRKFISVFSKKNEPERDDISYNLSTTKSNSMFSSSEVKKYESRLRKDVSNYLNDLYSYTYFYELRNLVYNDSQVSSLWNTRLTSLSLPYRISKGKSNEEVFEFVCHQFSFLDVYMISKLMMNAIAFGFSALELTWRLTIFKNKYLLLVKDIDFIPNEKIEIKNENIYYRKDFYTEKPLKLHPAKVLFLINGKEHGNHGYPLFYPIWKEYKKKELTDFYHLNFIEKLTGVIYLLKSNTEKSKEENNKAFDAVKGIENIHALHLDSGYTLELKELLQKHSTNETFIKAKTYNDEQIAKVILGQTLTTESGTTGSYALGKTHEGVRMDYATADRKFCESGFNDLIKKIVILNFGIQEYYPEFSYKTNTLERDAILTRRLGVKFSKEYITENYGLNPDDFEIDMSLIEKGGKL